MSDIEPLTQHKRRLATDFDRVADGYDLLCRLNPGYRRHLRWSARRIGLRDQSARVLDLCCGTGLSTEALRSEAPGARITGMDASSGMLDRARAKEGLSDVEWREGDAMDPAKAGAPGPFDAIFMAYGLRNVTDPDLCLRRLHALLEPGGVLCLHEYAVAQSQFSRIKWKAVTSLIVIPLGKLVTGTTTIFRYLRRSVLEFDGAPQVEERLRRAGFVEVRTERMDGWQRGVVHTFLGRKPA